MAATAIVMPVVPRRRLHGPMLVRRVLRRQPPLLRRQRLLLGRLLLLLPLLLLQQALIQWVHALDVMLVQPLHA